MVESRDGLEVVVCSIGEVGVWIWNCVLLLLLLVLEWLSRWIEDDVDVIVVLL